MKRFTGLSAVLLKEESTEMNGTMRALRYLEPGVVKVQEMPIPQPNEGEVLLKVDRCGICGSDVHGYLGLTGRRIPPMTLGHEFSAIVAETRPDTKKFAVGDKVVVQPIHFCGTCVNCKQGLTNMCLNKRFFGVLTVDGAMAEYIAVPEKLLYRVPQGVGGSVAALTEPYAVAYGSVKKAGDLGGKTVLIIGAGAIGLCILQMVLLQKPKMIVMCDLSDKRLENAKHMGANETINPKTENYLEKIEKLTDGLMMDISFEAVGVEATANQSIKALKVGGTAMWVGMSQKEMTINMQDIVCSARAVIGSFNYTHKEFGEVVDLLGQGGMQASELISEEVGLEGVLQALQNLHDHPDDYIKILIDPQK
ncbi:MAG: zinc-binding dehydrogenase [Oscillospiraceae bacterium]